MSDDIGKESDELQGSHAVEMRIILEPGKPMVVHFPLLADKIATYGFLKFAEKTLDAHYATMASKVIKPGGNGGVMNFIRGRG